MPEIHLVSFDMLPAVTAFYEMDNDSKVEDVKQERIQNKKCEQVKHSHHESLPENDMTISAPTSTETPTNIKNEKQLTENFNIPE